MTTPKPEQLVPGITLYQGDCLDVLRTLEPGRVDAVITDPPYSERTHKGHDATASGHAGGGWDGADRKRLDYAPWTQTDVRRVVPELCRVSAGWVVVMTDHVLAPSIMAAMEQCGRYVFAPLPFYAPGSRCRLSGDGPSAWTIWIVVGRTKRQSKWGTLPGGYSPDGKGIWRDKEHMGGKPTGLMRALVRDYSRAGGTIFAPFAGSGTTGVAAALEGRKCILIEQDPTYCDVIRRRIDEVYQQTPGTLFAEIPTC